MLICPFHRAYCTGFGLKVVTVGIIAIGQSSEVPGSLSCDPIIEGP